MVLEYQGSQTIDLSAYQATVQAVAIAAVKPQLADVLEQMGQYVHGPGVVNMTPSGADIVKGRCTTCASEFLAL